MFNTSNPKFISRICVENVHDKDKDIQCEVCDIWVHIKCNNLNYLDFRYLQYSGKSWNCIEYFSVIFLSIPYHVVVITLVGVLGKKN